MTDILSQYATTDRQKTQDDIEEVKAELDQADLSLDSIKLIKN